VAEPPRVPTGDEKPEGTWHNRYMTLFDRAPVPAATCQATGRVLGVNPAFAELWGLSRTKIRGCQLTDLFEPADTDARDTLAEALRSTRPSRHPLRVRWNVGDTVYTGQVTIEPVNDSVFDEVPLFVFLHADPEPLRTGPPSRRQRYRISPTEQRILALMASGSTTAAAARTIGMTADGVTYHLTRLCRRFGVPNRTALVAKAYVTGVLDPTSWPPAPAN
jgi:PAS domain S-box-containing protein